MPGIFSRYTKEKYDTFMKWLATKHGQTIYTLFRQFSETYRNAGHARCGANLVGNRIRWECSVGEFVGFKEIGHDWIRGRSAGEDWSDRFALGKPDSAVP